MAVPNTFGTATSAIPLSQLDANFNTPITLGNTAIQLGDTVTTLNNMTLANVTISSGNVTITNVAITTANVSGTANISTLVVVGNATVGGNTTITGNITAANANVTTNLVLSNGTANGVAYLNTNKVLTTGSALVFDATNTALSVGGAALGTAANRTVFTLNATTSNFLSFGIGGTRVAHFYSDANEFAIANASGAGGFITMQTNGAEALRLTATSLYTASTINVGIGTSLPQGSLDVTATGATVNQFLTGGAGNNSVTGIFRIGSGSGRGASIQGFRGASSNIHSLDFYTYNAADVFGMRLDSSGNLLVGTTNTAENAGVGFKLLTSGQVACITTANTTNAQMSTYELYSTGASAFRFYVGAGGTIFATSTTITAISDQRLKENIRDLDDGLASVMALKPRKFDWKKGKGANIKDARGFIAQEFETVFPDMIDEWRDPAPEGEEPYKAINANLIPTLVKAIQELKAEFDAYKASHP